MISRIQAIHCSPLNLRQLRAIIDSYDTYRGPFFMREKNVQILKQEIPYFINDNKAIFFILLIILLLAL